MTEKPYCEAQVGGMECGVPVMRWGYQCVRHDPKGRTRSHPCPNCWRVLYSKSALTRHINREHWDEEINTGSVK